ncbi:DUF6261 family protein [Parabacteroides sp. APC149_11_2_Y6]
MAKIQNFPKSRLRSNELLAAGRAIEQQIQTAGASALGVTGPFENFRKALQAYDDSLVKLTKSVMTTEMRAADKKRDSMQSAILSQIRTFANHFEADKQAAAKRLIPFADKYKNTTQLSFNDQTGMTENFIQATESDTMKADFAALGLTAWVSELKKANAECAALSDARRTESGQRNTPQKSVDTRPAFDVAYETLVEALNALALVNGDSKYLELFTWWNAMIDEFRVSVSLRHGKGKGGKTDSGNSNRPNPDAGDGNGGSDGDKPEEL